MAWLIYLDYTSALAYEQEMLGLHPREIKKIRGSFEDGQHLYHDQWFTSRNYIPFCCLNQDFLACLPGEVICSAFSMLLPCSWFWGISSLLYYADLFPCKCSLWCLLTVKKLGSLLQIDRLNRLEEVACAGLCANGSVFLFPDIFAARQR